jgi:hypothetical protein
MGKEGAFFEGYIERKISWKILRKFPFISGHEVRFVILTLLDVE